MDNEVGEAERYGAVLTAHHPPGRLAQAGRLAVRFALAEARPLTLDALGRRVTRLWDGPVAVGEHRAAWDTGAVAPGVYLLCLTGADGARALRRVTVAG